MASVSATHFTSPNGGEVIAPHYPQWNWREEMKSRENRGSILFASARAVNTRGAYRRCARRLQPLLKSSPSSKKLRRWVELCLTLANDPRLRSSSRAPRPLLTEMPADGFVEVMSR